MGVNADLPDKYGGILYDPSSYSLITTPALASRLARYSARHHPPQLASQLAHLWREAAAHAVRLPQLATVPAPAKPHEKAGVGKKKSRTCAHCGASGKLRVCSGCNRAYFCSVEVNTRCGHAHSTPHAERFEMSRKCDLLQRTLSSAAQCQRAGWPEHKGSCVQSKNAKKLAPRSCSAHTEDG